MKKKASLRETHSFRYSLPCRQKRHSHDFQEKDAAPEAENLHRRRVDLRHFQLVRRKLSWNEKEKEPRLVAVNTRMNAERRSLLSTTSWRGKFRLLRSSSRWLQRDFAAINTSEKTISRDTITSNPHYYTCIPDSTLMAQRSFRITTLTSALHDYSFFQFLLGSREISSFSNPSFDDVVGLSLFWKILNFVPRKWKFP